MINDGVFGIEPHMASDSIGWHDSIGDGMSESDILSLSGVFTYRLSIQCARHRIHVPECDLTCTGNPESTMQLIGKAAALERK